MASIMTINGKLPLTRRPKKNLRNKIKDFMYTGKKYGEFVWTTDDYKNFNSARSCFYRAVKHSGEPIKIITENERIFLMRKDI